MKKQLELIEEYLYYGRKQRKLAEIGDVKRGNPEIYPAFA